MSGRSVNFAISVIACFWDDDVFPGPLPELNVDRCIHLLGQKEDGMLGKLGNKTPEIARLCSINAISHLSFALPEGSRD